MYSLGVRRHFIARHFMIGGDWGAENSPNSHQYLLELQLEGPELDRHGFLVDIAEVDRHLDGLVEHYQEKMLNDLPEFQDLNPSLERFASNIGLFLLERMGLKGVSGMRVVLWENDSAWAALTWKTGSEAAIREPARH
jgi:6-pyruvoyltetrahydropterin/6-carboxytetrahydropterin synthase